MRKPSYIKAGLFIALLVLTQSLLLIHASVHALQTDNTATCELCLAADNLGASHVGGQFEFVAQPLTVLFITLPSTSYLGSFQPQSPLPRAPPSV